MKGVEITQVVGEYVSQKFGDTPLPLASYVSALVQPRPDPDSSDIASLINTALYKFNKNRLSELLEHRAFAFLLLDFLEDPIAVQSVFSRSKSPQAFRNLIEVIKDRCREALR